MPLFDARVGHEEIDAQHQAMLSCLAELGSRLEGGDAGGSTAVLESLWRETVAHLALEEELMNSLLYPERDAHRTAHQLFLQDVQGLMRLVAEQGPTEEALARRARILDWFAYHIEANDLPLARFLSRRAASRAGGASDRPAPRRSDA